MSDVNAMRRTLALKGDLAPQDRISRAVLTILADATCTDMAIKLNCPQLERALYEQVDDVLQRIGGKWSGRKKAHLFSYDPIPMLNAILTTGEMPAKNPTAYFPTPRSLVEQMIGAGTAYGVWWEDAKVLEPSAGQGGIADVVRAQYPNIMLDCVELLPINAHVLRTKDYAVYEQDFLTYISDNTYDVVIMNPPFSLPDDKTAWMTHIYHAWSLLREDGVLLAIVPTGIVHRIDTKHVEFRKFALLHGDWQEIPAGTFKESGTDVSTVLLCLKKQDQTWRRKPIHGWSNWYVWCAQLHAESDYETFCAMQQLGKQYQSDLLDIERATAGLRTIYERVCATAIKQGEPLFLEPEDYDVLIIRQLHEYKKS